MTNYNSQVSLFLSKFNILKFYTIQPYRIVCREERFVMPNINELYAIFIFVFFCLLLSEKPLEEWKLENLPNQRATRTFI